jgi:hypothetical protein
MIESFEILEIHTKIQFAIPEWFYLSVPALPAGRRQAGRESRIKNQYLMDSRFRGNDNPMWNLT